MCELKRTDFQFYLLTSFFLILSFWGGMDDLRREKGILDTCLGFIKNFLLTLQKFKLGKNLEERVF